MKTTDKTAIVLGATGLTGSLLVQRLLDDDRYETVKVFTRRSLGVEHQKLVEHQCDLLKLKNESEHFYGDEVYCCIGTTKAKTPNKEMYRKIDFGIPVTAAELCKKNNIDTYLVVSALGADANSRVFYNRIKGEMEDAVLEMGIKNIYLLQPSLIAGKRKEARPTEYIFKQLMKLLNIVLAGPLKKYQSIAPETIADALVLLANSDYKMKRIPSDKIADLVKNT